MTAIGASLTMAESVALKLPLYNLYFDTVKGFPDLNNETPFIPCYYKLQFNWHIVPNARLTTSYSRKDLEKLYSTEFFPMYE